MRVADGATSRIQALNRSTPVVRFGTQFGWDAMSWVVALVLAQVLRYDLQVSQIAWLPLLILCVAAAILQFFVGWHFYLYQGRHPYGSFAEVRALLWAVLTTTVCLGIPVVVAGTLLEIPRSTVFAALPFAFVLMGG